MSEQMAIAAMVLDPILIKRPLLQVGAAYGCGFDSELATRLVQNKDVSALLSCSKPKGSSSCD
jgi:arsenate reductase-like glutaredoxin family protein